MSRDNSIIVFITVLPIIAGIGVAIYKLFIENIKIDNDNLKLNLEKQRLELEIIKFKEEKKSTTIEHDKEIYKKFLEILPSNSESIVFLKEKSFRSPFNNNEFHNFHKLYYDFNGEEDKFVDIDMNLKQKELYNSISSLINDIAMKTYPLEHNAQYNSVPSEWQNNKQNKLFEKTVQDLDKLGENTLKIYEELIQIAKKKLY